MSDAAAAKPTSDVAAKAILTTEDNQVKVLPPKDPAEAKVELGPPGNKSEEDTKGSKSQEKATRVETSTDTKEEVKTKGRRNDLPKGSRAVGVGMKVESVTNIDGVTNSFVATLKMSLEWKLTDEELEGWRKDYWQSLDLAPNQAPWMPTIIWPSALDQQITFPMPAAATGPKDEIFGIFRVFPIENVQYVIIYYQKRIKFSQIQDLHNFPFDCQDLHIVIRSQDVSKCMLVPRFKSDKFSSIVLDSCGISEQWIVYPPLANFIVKSNSISRSGKDHSDFVLQLKLQRRHEFYTHRILTLAGALSGSSMFSFFIIMEDANRIVLCLTVLLTLVAFQLAVETDLPKVQYYTCLEIYLVFSQIFIIGVSIVSSYICRFVDNWDESDIYLYIFLYIFAGFQFVYAAYAKWVQHHEKKKLTLSVEELAQYYQAKNERMVKKFGKRFKNKDSELKLHYRLSKKTLKPFDTNDGAADIYFDEGKAKKKKS